MFSKVHEQYHQKESMKYGVNGKILERLFIFDKNEYLTVKQFMRTLIAPFSRFNRYIFFLGIILYLIIGELSIFYILSNIMMNLSTSSSDIWMYFKLLLITKTSKISNESKIFMRWDEEINGIPQNVYFVIEDKIS